MLDFLNIFFEYISSLLLIDFTSYTGSLPTELVSMYGYFTDFFKLVIIFYFLYLVFNSIIFIISLGGVRRERS